MMNKNGEAQLTNAIEQMACILAGLTSLRNVYLSDESRRKGAPETIFVYWAGCRGLADLAKSLGQRVTKIGTTNDDNLEGRLKILGKDQYGALRLNEADAKAEAGFDNWMCFAFPVSRDPRFKEIEVSARSIKIVLPHGVTRRTFDNMLHAALCPWRLDRRHPAAKRWTAYRIGGVRISQAMEFYVGLDPRKDGNVLLGIVETICEACCAKTLQQKSAKGLQK